MDYFSEELIRKADYVLSEAGI